MVEIEKKRWSGSLKVVVVIGSLCLVSVVLHVLAWAYIRREPSYEELTRRMIQSAPVNLLDQRALGYSYELVIIGSEEVDVLSVVAKFDGVVTAPVSETNTYQVRFPASSLADLETIMDELNEIEGIEASQILLYTPPLPGEPQ